MATLSAKQPELALLAGDLNARTVVELLPQGTALITQAPSQWVLDLSAVQAVSSAAVALLVEWLKVAKAQRKPFYLLHLPESLAPIIAISDLTPLFAPLLRPGE